MEGIFSSLFSISPWRVFTYQPAHTPINSLAPTHRELRSVREREEQKKRGRGRKRGSLEGFDMYSRTYMATSPAEAALHGHICARDWRGPAYERQRVNSSLQSIPRDPFCCLKISVKFRLGGRRAEVKRMQAQADPL